MLQFMGSQRVGHDLMAEQQNIREKYCGSASQVAAEVPLSGLTRLWGFLFPQPETPFFTASWDGFFSAHNSSRLSQIHSEKILLEDVNINMNIYNGILLSLKEE